MYDFLKKENRFNLLSFLIGLFWLLIGSLFFIVPLYVIGPKITGLSLVDYLKSSYIVDHTYIPGSLGHMFGIMMFIVFFSSYIIKDAKGFKDNWLLSIGLILVGFGLMYGANKLMELIYTKLGITDTSANQQSIINSLTGSMSWLVIIFVTVLAPLFEEIVFRKLFYNTLKMNTKLHPVLIVLIISIVFAGIHVVGDVNSLKFFPQYFILALLLTSVYALSKENIFVSFGLHALNNIYSVLEILVF